MTTPRPGRPAASRAAFNRLRTAQKNSRGAPRLLALHQPSTGPGASPLAAYVLRGQPEPGDRLSALFTFSGIAVLAALPPTCGTGVVVAVLLIIGYALDSADGQLARLLGGGSPEGEWLDHVVDSAKLATIHLAVLVSMYRHFDGRVAGGCWCRWSSPRCSRVHFFGMIVTDLVLREHHYRTGAGEPYRASVLGDAHSTVLTIARIPVDYGLLCLGFVLLGAYPAVPRACTA